MDFMLLQRVMLAETQVASFASNGGLVWRARIRNLLSNKSSTRCYYTSYDSQIGLRK